MAGEQQRGTDQLGTLLRIDADERANAPGELLGVGLEVLERDHRDIVAPERRGKPVAVYSTALSLGAGIASLIGAAVLVWAKNSAGIVLPVFGMVSAWQVTFLAVGLPWANTVGQPF